MPPAHTHAHAHTCVAPWFLGAYLPLPRSLVGAPPPCPPGVLHESPVTWGPLHSPLPADWEALDHICMREREK